MLDMIEELRMHGGEYEVCNEAADEIERLREIISGLRQGTCISADEAFVCNHFRRNEPCPYLEAYEQLEMNYD